MYAYTFTLLQNFSAVLDFFLAWWCLHCGGVSVRCFCWGDSLVPWEKVLNLFEPLFLFFQMGTVLPNPQFYRTRRAVRGSSGGTGPGGRHLTQRPARRLLPAGSRAKPAAFTVVGVSPAVTAGGPTTVAGAGTESLRLTPGADTQP